LATAWRNRRHEFLAIGIMSPWRSALARGIYSMLLRLLKPLYLLRLWTRGKAEPMYRDRIGERFGNYSEAPSSGWIWVHAVSLGETRAAAALIDALRIELSSMRLLLTHGTATGREAGRDLLREGDRQTWLPFDTPEVVARFFDQFRPSIGVLMETEIWPNLLLAARRRGLPMVLANARLSDRSLRRGQRFESMLRPAVESLTLVLAQSDGDAQRLRDSGAPAVEVSGNLKYDLSPDAAQLAQGAAWRSMIARDVVLAAITREGEEEMLLSSWTKDRSTTALLLIVPRHPQRFDEVAGLVRAAGLTLSRRSEWATSPPPDALQSQVWLGDSMREMALYYAMSNVALLGGSFAPLGGHNLIEAAACGCPLVIGPSTFNFQEAAALSLAAGASVRAVDMADGVAQACDLLSDPQRLAKISFSAVHFAAQHRGAAARMARKIVLLIRAE
jgi:3-deoxy-D-manno-octulosonic-acid transferase